MARPAVDGSNSVVFRKENRHESFQRQISALRQQLSADQDEELQDYSVDDPGRSPLHISQPPDDWDDAEPLAGSTAAELPLVGTADTSTGVIAANSQWNGTLRSQGSVHVYGAVEGELIADDEVYVAEGAIVRAKVAAATIVVAGTLDGTVECTRRLEVLATGHVSGEVTAPTLVVHEGATVEGDLTMRAPEPAST
jgi:cytoskeletal protein CcmA (bactofilin family)